MRCHKCGEPSPFATKHGFSCRASLDKLENPPKNGEFRFEILRDTRLLRTFSLRCSLEEATATAVLYYKGYQKLLNDVVVIATSEKFHRIVVRREKEASL